jgi:NarL family two-component system response regulator LiaR
MSTAQETNGAGAIRVLIVDDHFMVRDGLKIFVNVSAGMTCVGEADSGEAALRLCERLRPDVVLMDLMMPGMDGVETTEQIRKQYPATRIVALTSFADKELVQRAVRAGATGYLLKNASMPQLSAAIRQAHEGRATLSVEAAEALMSVVSEPEAPGQDLTEREREVLVALGEGLTNLEIARALGISESTTRFHISNVFMKLGVTNRTEAVRFAMRHKLIS